MDQLQVAQHPASVDAYIRHGWSLVPIPIGTKGPTSKGWNLRESALRSSTDLPPGGGIGLAHAYSGTMALDIDDWSLATALLAPHGIDLHTLYLAPDSVTIVSGRQGRGKLLFAMPFGSTLPSKKIRQGGVTAYELRCATLHGLTVQDVLPPSIHPDTRMPYQWGGLGHWTRLPTIPIPLLDHWQTLLAADDVRSIPTTEPIAASWSEIESAMEHLDPSCGRDEWVEIGMALQYAGQHTNNVDHAMGLWESWSAKSHKYPGPREMAIQWRSFRTDKPGVVTLGTLFHRARERGWTRQFDASSLFSKVEPPVEPDLLLASITPPPPDLDLSLFPDALRARAVELSECVGCDPLLPLMAGMGAACGALDSRMRLELVPGFKVPPVLWLMCIGDPASKKSPGSSPMFDPLRAIQREGISEFERMKLRFDAQEARHKSAMKAYLDAAASPEALLPGFQLPPVPDPPLKPVDTRLFIQDSTSQKIVRLAADRPAGMLLWMDEMKTWIGRMTNPMSGEDRSCVVSGYEAKPYTMDRVGAGTIHCDNYAISIFGNVQPRVLRKQMAGMGDDGLLQRFFPVVLRAKMARLGEPLPDYMTKAAQWETTVRFLHSLPPQTYRLGNDAYGIFRGFQMWFERQKVNHLLLSTGDAFLTAFGKIEGTIGRIALLFHLFENPYAPEVTGATMLRAVTLARTYVVPSLRYAFTEVGNKSEFDRWLCEYVIRHSDESSVTMGAIRASARRQIEDKPSWEVSNLILAGMWSMEQARWVIRLDDGSQEHKQVAQWAINPALHRAFADHRRRLIQAKRELQDHIASGATEAFESGD